MLCIRIYLSRAFPDSVVLNIFMCFIYCHIKLNKKQISSDCISIPLGQYLVEPPLIVFTAASLLENFSVSFAYLDSDFFAILVAKIA